MKTRMLHGLVWVALAVVPAWLAVDVSAADKKPTKTVTGKIKGADIKGGKTLSVYIDDAEQGEFLVLRGTEVGKELLKQVGATVKATGRVSKAYRDPGYDHVIDVVEYEVVTPAPAKKAPEAAAKRKTG